MKGTAEQSEWECARMQLIEAKQKGCLEALAAEIVTCYAQRASGKKY